eukprot:TRINITY_DN24299_c0_g1_i1.p1 TRINITY_DN24299_c0_g1~~TRINITY_DN24299_c0_g1_i1.p1  ORF type:complete len:356 (+),score=53.02 TRINITY_DN24299_c0_g1_i1:61-1068(+)
MAISVLMSMTVSTTWPDVGSVVGVLGVPGSQGCDSLEKGIEVDNVKDDGGFSCFTTVYAKWLEQSGARVVTIPYDMKEAEPERLDDLIDSLNGFLLTGGGLEFAVADPPAPVKSYMETLTYLYNAVGRKHDEGVYLPLWGTCMGFQTLSVVGAGHNISVMELGVYDSEDLSLPINPTPGARNSRLFRDAPQDVYEILTTQNVTANLHHDGVPPSNFVSNPTLSKAFKLLSTNVDRKGRPFGSTMEHVSLPIYATQFHPERPQFEWTTGHGFNRSIGCFRSMAYLSQFFVSETHKNSQTINSTDLLGWANNHTTDGMHQMIDNNRLGCDGKFIFTR